MSSIGKIFIVVNLALAALALGWATNHLETANNYKQEKADLQVEMDTAIKTKDGEIEDLRNNLNTEKTARSSAKSELAAANADRDRLQAELTREQDRGNQMSAELATMTASLQSYAESNDNLQGRWEQSEANLRNEMNSRRDAEQAQGTAEQAQRDAESALSEAQDQITGFERHVTSLTKANSQLEIDLQALVEHTGVSVVEIANMPLIDGAVLGVNAGVAPGLVSINKGSADGVKRGFTFEVYAGAQYKGRVRVVEVQGNMCVAEIVKTVGGRTISQGDAASTRI
ncbi:MAG: hypothetical protein CMJ86_01770 [Planctomycetes bacterium]|jgi:hypothetical protein|nr:hypothetical protein [Planctomycetota bacterium]